MIGQGFLRKSVCPIVAAVMVAASATAAPAAATPATGPSSAVTTMLLPAGHQGDVADIPWSQVGPGWLLSEWLPVAPSPSSAPAKRLTLYLVDPLGGRYVVTTVSALGGDLVAWSGDGQRALFVTQTTTSLVVTVLQLPNGRSGTFKIDGSGSRSIGFTEPDGLAIITSGQGPGGGAVRVQRLGLNGALEHAYPASFPRAGRITLNGEPLYSPDGTELVLGTTHGFEVVVNSGQPLRYLPMGPGAGACQPARWWAAGVFLASCTPPDSIPRLWLVPTNGEPPRPLTATPKPGSGDYGDVDAWSLPGGDYLQDLGACGYIYLARLGRGGRTTPVKVPGTEADKSVRVLGANGDQLALISAFSCYPGSASLMWFDPATNAVTPLLGPPVNGGSVGMTLLWGEPPYSNEF